MMRQSRWDKLWHAAREAVNVIEMPRSDDAKIRALARDLVERRGGEQASRLADLLVSQVQAVRRGF